MHKKGKNTRASWWASQERKHLHMHMLNIQNVTIAVSKNIKIITKKLWWHELHLLGDGCAILNEWTRTRVCEAFGKIQQWKKL